MFWAKGAGLGAALLCASALGAAAQEGGFIGSADLGEMPLGAPAPEAVAPEAAAGEAISCALRASREVKVAAPTTGVIASVAVKPGQRVAKGDLLAKFDSRLVEAELALARAKAGDTTLRETAKARYEGLKTRHERLLKALKSKAVSQSEVESAKLELDLALGELDRAEAELRFAALEAERVSVMLEKTEVRSPVDGMIGEALINPGEAPDSQQPIALILVTDPLRIEAWVPARLAPALLQAKAHWALIAGSPREITFDYAAAAADMSSGTISFFYKLQADDLLPGLDCSLILAAGGKEP